MKRHALAIGLNEWTDRRIQPLKCAEYDARAVAKLLSRLHFDRVEDLVGPEVTLDRVLAHTESMMEDLEASLIVFPARKMMI